MLALAASFEKGLIWMLTKSRHHTIASGSNKKHPLFFWVFLDLIGHIVFVLSQALTFVLQVAETIAFFLCAYYE